MRQEIVSRPGQIQARLQAENRREYRFPDKKTTYHKQAGAAKAWRENQFGVAFAIAGHHGGLPNRDSAQKAEKCDAGSAAVAGLWAEAIADCPGAGGLRLGRVRR